MKKIISCVVLLLCLFALSASNVSASWFAYTEQPPVKEKKHIQTIDEFMKEQAALEAARPIDGVLSRLKIQGKSKSESLEVVELTNGDRCYLYTYVQGDFRMTTDVRTVSMFCKFK